MSSGQGSLFDDFDELRPPAAPAEPAVPTAAPGPERDAPRSASDEPGETEGSPPSKDDQARRFAVDPRNHVVLEASAGTGKTSVLVERYINLLRAGVEPANILAITFTRKAAAEMRERIIRGLREAAARSEIDRKRWLELRDSLSEIAISTIDAFCLSLLREFPLEADLDPGFDVADETEVPRLVDEALDRALRIFTHQARTDPDIALVLAQLGVSRTREGLAVLLERRLVAWDALDRFLAQGPADLTAQQICRRTATALLDVLRTAPGGLRQLLADGPMDHPRYQLLVREINRLADPESLAEAAIRSVIDRVCQHFLTGEGKPRRGSTLHGYRAEHYPSADGSKRHRAGVLQLGEPISRVVTAFRRDLNVVLARGVRKMFTVALAQYRRALDARSVLDFSDVLERALALLRQMDEFSQSRFRLESRYHHVLVDEFQDTSRAQWELVSLLIESWGEGLGVATQPSIFIVGDRKQSIYRFRDAEVAVLDDAARYIERLRPAGGSGGPRRAITRSFRAVPELLAFVNDVFTEVAQPGGRPDDFRYEESDRFPVSFEPDPRRAPALGISAAADPETCAAAVAAEIERVLREDSVRDKKTGVPRSPRAGDIAILFRSRASHREFEQALEARGIPTYVYKGLGFFDADEIKDVSALMRYLANPDSDLRAAAFLRSRFVRLSDAGLAALAPALAGALVSSEPPAAAVRLTEEDGRVLEYTRQYLKTCLPLVDRIPPADLVEQVLPQTAYACELRGPRLLQAWENLKKMRALVRRIQNRGYATLARIADHIDSLSAGDESNAVIEALDAVNLMTVHASKGLEFPIVFVVNVAKGASGPPRPMRVIAQSNGEPSVSIGPFVSEVDEAERERDKQETRRLLYVALTRARDRLYLSSALKDGVFAPGPGSLGEVLPESVRALFARAATAFDEMPAVAWTGASGHTFELIRCRPPAAQAVVQEVAAAKAGRPYIAPRILPTRPTLPVTGSDLDLPTALRELRSDPRIAGRLVHRLFEVGSVADVAGEEALARRLLWSEERAALTDADAAVAAALDAWRALRDRDDVRRLLTGGVRLHEVPFSMHEPVTSSIVRGTIDCLVLRPDGSIVVVEFKTGAPRPEHEQQLAAYTSAARALFPAAPVECVLLYP